MKEQREFRLLAASDNSFVQRIMLVKGRTLVHAAVNMAIAGAEMTSARAAAVLLELLQSNWKL